MKKIAALLLAVATAMTLVVSGGASGVGASGSNPPYPFAPNLPTVTAIPNPVAPNKPFRAEARWYCPKVPVVFTVLAANNTAQQTTKTVTTNTGGTASATFTGLPAGTYTIRAAQTKPSSGNLAKTCKVSITTFTTLVVEVDVTPPGPAQNFAAVALSSTSIKLTWTAATGGPSSYQIRRASSGSGPWTGAPIGTVSASSPLTFTNTGLTPSTTYHYQIVALDAAGNISTPEVASATTSAAVGITVNGYATVAGGRRMAVLTWTGNTGKVDVIRSVPNKPLTVVKRSYSSQQYTDVVPSGVTVAVYYVCPTGVRPPSSRCGSISLSW